MHEGTCLRYVCKSTKLCASLLIWVYASIRQRIVVTKRSSLIKSILEVSWVHCNGLYEMNTCSYGSFTKVVTFMRAFCNLIVVWCDPTLKEGRYWEIPCSGCSVFCMYQGTVPLSTGVRLFGVLSLTSVGNRFYVQDCRNHSTWFWCKRNILREACKYILQENILCCWIVLSSL